MIKHECQNDVIEKQNNTKEETEIPVNLIYPTKLKNF